MKSRLIPYPLLLLIVAAAYFGAAKLGLSQAFLHANVSSVWPPTGLAIATVWWLGYRILPAILLGAFLVNLATDVSIATAGGIAVGNTLEAVSAVFLLRRFAGLGKLLDRARDTVKFVLIAGVLSTMVSATMGNISLCLGGAAAWINFGPLWLTWWLGDGVGALVVAPLLLTWFEKPTERWTLPQLAEAMLLLASLTMVAAVVFGGWLLPKLASYPLEHLTVPFLLWAAFRFGPRGAATAIAVLSGIAIWGTRRGFGPFAAHSPNESLLLLQVFVAAAAITTLVLAAIVTERKRIEEALRAKEAQLQLITDITPVMLTQCSRERRYRFANRAYAETFGLMPEQIAGQPISEIIGEEAYEVIRPYIDLVLQGQSVDYEAEIPYQQVGRRFMRIAYGPDRDAEGNVIGWVASLSDITDRQHAEEQIKKLNAELQRRVEEFQTLIDTAPVGIAVAMDPECNHIWGNPEFVQMLGIEQEENISKSGLAGDSLPFKAFRNGQEVSADDLPMQRACREDREVLDEELEIVRGDGKRIYELCRATPLRDEQGRVRGCISVFLDITERKQVEVEREQLLVREREALAKAEAVNRVKDEFLATVSHELRTPLNSMLGWSQLLRAGQLDKTNAARGLETIERNAKAQAQLIDDLLDVSRIITGKLRLNTCPVEITGIIRAAIDMVRPAATAKAIQLEFSTRLAALSIAGDPDRLQQVVWNLLSNAIKFTPKGGRVEIQMERQDANVRLTIIDNGAGISPEFLPYVFDRFRQADSSRTRRHGGLGLGLAIVRHLIEMHGGSVEAYSAGENRGATFTVTLPLIVAANDFENTETDRRIEPSETLPILFGIRLLIVEDDPDSLEMLRVVVELQGAEVKTATRTSEALRILEQWIPDVLISDIGMPDEDGYTLISKIRMSAHEKRRQLPAIALTGYAEEPEGQRALAAGFQIYLAKPAEPGKLVEAITKLAARAEKR